MLEVNGIIGLLILFADIYAILKIAQSSATVGLKAVWIIVVLLLPVIGLIVWYLFGPRD
jgi:hypothetical protein